MLLLELELELEVVGPICTFLSSSKSAVEGVHATSAIERKISRIKSLNMTVMFETIEACERERCLICLRSEGSMR